MEKKWFIHYRIYIITALLLVCFYGLNIGRIYGFSIFPDEFTYWSYAARVAGYDWSNMISLGSYYSYGYSFILFPVFAIFDDAVTAYRVAIGINFVFLFLTFIYLVKVARKLVPDKNIPVELFSIIVILFPGNLFYAQMTMTETLLLFLYVLEGKLLLDYFEKNRLITLCVLIMLLIYSYMVHMRTIGVFVSVIVGLFFHMLSEQGKKFHIWVIVGMFFIWLMVEVFMKKWAFEFVYGGVEQELIKGNDYSGQLEKIRYVFSKSGIYDLFISIFGKILYLGLATYGLFYWGLIALIKEIRSLFSAIKRQIEVTEKQKFAIVIFLSIVAQIMIATIYLLTLGEASDYTYGRYTELVLPFVMFLGMTELWKEYRNRAVIVTILVAMLQFLMMVLVVKQIMLTGAETFHGFFMIGISYLYNENTFQIDVFYRDAYLFGEVLTVLVTLIIFFCRSNKKRYYLLMTLFVVELVLSMRAKTLFLDPLQKAAFRDKRMAEKIQEMQGEKRRLIYVDDCFPVYAGILQFMERDIIFQVVERKDTPTDYGEVMNEHDLIIVSFDSSLVQKWDKVFSHVYTYGHFTLLYND